MPEWIYPIQLDRYGLADERLKESLEALREETGFDIEDEQEFDLAWSALRGPLKETSAADWERIVGTLDHETLVFCRELLHEHWEDAVVLMGRHKYWQLRGIAWLRHLGHPQARWRMTNPDGAIRLFVLRQQWGTSYPSKPQIPYYKLAKALGATDKTVKEWDERMATNPPPKDNAFDYFCEIVRPPYKRKGGGA